MKQQLFRLACACGLGALPALAGEHLTPVQLANPLQGTDSSWGYSHGNTYPAIALPFPINSWAPYCLPDTEAFYYQWDHDEIRGIRETHKPSAWVSEYGAFSLMPVSGKLVFTDKDRVSKFSHKDEIAQPSYYKVHFDTWSATGEVTPTERAAMFRFSFEKGVDSYVILDIIPSDKAAEVEINPAQNKVIGIARGNGAPVPGNFGNYLVVTFDQPFVASGVWNNETATPDATNTSGRHVGAYFKFDGSKTPVVTCRVASSYISHDQAQRNLDTEIGSATFETIRQRAEDRWNEMLGRAAIEGGTEEQQRTFYSALYRAILFPQRFDEVDAQGHTVYYSPNDGKVHEGHMYTDSGYWDTFRSAHPLYNLLYPEISAQIVESAINTYKESGWLPQWPCPGNRQIMIGNHSFSLLADAWVKGVRSFDLNTAVDAMVHDAHGTAFGLGRSSYEDYDRLGYVPFSGRHLHEPAVSKSLEYAYDDACAAEIAKAAGRDKEAAAFLHSAMNYTNDYDAASGFMRGREEDGKWSEPFDPLVWGDPYTEGNAWQWTWSVMQDGPGLISLMGGDKAFGRKLDEMFAVSTDGPEVKTGSYHNMIHEMREMVAQNFGQYAHCNEPVHHVIYMYDLAGQPWKAQIRLREVMNELYQSTPDGISGDEDTGQMSAWYVFTALGIYPECPGTDAYTFGSPLFDKAILTVAGGKKFTIVAHKNGPQRPYIQSARLNGQDLNKIYVTHQQVTDGGQLTFEMTPYPDYNWATGQDARPPSLLQTLLNK